MSDKMVIICGKEISEDTIVEALKKHCDFDIIEWEHGDIAYCLGEKGNKSSKRLFIEVGDRLRVFANAGEVLYSKSGEKTAQQIAKEFDYIKTGNIFED